jgi:hypothetical protein
MKKIKCIILMVILAFTFSGCGSSEDEVQNGDYETALYLSYATATSSNIMNSITVQDFLNFITVMGGIAQAYYTEYGEFPVEIDLANPPSGITIPSGLSGTITTVITLPYPIITGNITFAGYSANSRTFSGKINAVVYYDITKLDFNSLLIEISQLEISYANLDYKSTTYSGYKLAIDKSSTPKYTIDGSVNVDGRVYSYYGYTFQNLTTSIALSGDIVEGGIRFNVSGSPVPDSSGVWRSGTLILGLKDSSDETSVTNQCTVTLSTNSANFQITDGEQWALDNWFDSKLVP